MRKSLFLALLASSLLVLSGAAGRAATFSDIDTFFKPLSKLNPTYTDSFNITSRYNRALKSVASAKAWFLVSDNPFSPDWLPESAAVDLADQPFLGPESATFNLLSGDISGAALASLDSTGILTYTIRRTQGDFVALGAKLVVETQTRTVPGGSRVPDGGSTLMLLGTALAGPGSMRRLLARRSSRELNRKDRRD
jgi:hypothetical protein